MTKHKKRTINEAHSSISRPDARIGHGYGSLKSDMMGTAAAMRQSTWPYTLSFEETDPPEEIDDEDFDALQNKVGGRVVVNDPFAQGTVGKVRRYGPGMSAGPDLVLAGIARSAPHPQQTPMTSLSTKRRMYRGRQNTVTGGTYPKVFTTRAGGYNDKGSLQGWAMAPRPLFKSRAIYKLSDIYDEDIRAMKKSEEDVERIHAQNREE